MSKEEESEKEIKEALELIEKFSHSSSPLADAVIDVLLDTNVVQTFESEKDLLKKRSGFYRFLIKEASQSIAHVASTKKISPRSILSASALIESTVRGDKEGAISQIYREAKPVFSKLNAAKYALKFLSLSDLVVYSLFRANIVHRAEEKIQALQKEKSNLPIEQNELREKFQEQIETLFTFVQEEKKSLKKAVISESLQSVSTVLDLTNFALDIAEQSVASTQVAGTLGLAGSIVGLASTGLGLIGTGAALYQCGRNVSRYQEWLHVLQHTLDMVVPEEIKESVEERLQIEKINHDLTEEFKKELRPELFSSQHEGRKEFLHRLRSSLQERVEQELHLQQFPSDKKRAQHITSAVLENLIMHAVSRNSDAHFLTDVRVQTPPASLDERTEAFKELKKEIRAYIASELKANGISQAERQAEISSHIQLRKVCHDLSVKESGSEDQARRKEMLSSSIKNGLTNLALAKREIEKNLYMAHTAFRSLDAVLSLAGFVTTILGVIAVLCPPISSFVALGLLLGGGLLFAAGLIYQGVTRPNVLKITWGSKEGWTGFFDKIQAKYYGWRLESAKNEADKLEKMLAPTCFKIAILERLRLKDVPNKEELLSLMGVHVTKDIEKTKTVIDEQIERLRKSISPKDAKTLAALKGRIQVLTKNADAANKKIADMEERLAKAYEKDNIEWMKKNKDWRNLESLLSLFKEGIADNLVEGDELCVTILQEIHDETGIHFSREKIQEALLKKDSLKAVKERVRHAESEFQTLEREHRIAIEQRKETETKEKQESLQKAKEELEHAYAEKSAQYKNLLDVIGEPISHFLSRVEGNFAEIPALVRENKSKGKGNNR